MPNILVVIGDASDESLKTTLVVALQNAGYTADVYFDESTGPITIAGIPKQVRNEIIETVEAVSAFGEVLFTDIGIVITGVETPNQRDYRTLYELMIPTVLGTETSVLITFQVQGHRAYTIDSIVYGLDNLPSDRVITLKQLFGKQSINYQYR